MADWYVDYEGGNNANTGASFAQRFQTIDAATAAKGVAAGDTVRIMGSPNPTSLGISATWRGSQMEASKSISASTNASPIVVTVTGHGYSNGDFVFITGHTTNTNANGIWTIANVAADTFELVGSTGNGIGGVSGSSRKVNNAVVSLASSLTQTIASTVNRGEGRSAWVASANVTTSLQDTSFKCSDVTDQIAIAAGFTTGLAAYFDTPTLDLSGYQQISFWIRQTSGTVAVAGDISIRLCSDNAGVTTVDTINIPSIIASNNWQQVVVDTGVALGASIESIALYVDTDRGAQTFQFNNIIACKASSSADSITLASLIGKNTAGEPWLGIQSIHGTRVIIDEGTNQIPSASSPQLGYIGTTENVTTYKREAVKVGTGGAQAVQVSGTIGSQLVFSGGWDRVDMSTQTLETWWDGISGSSDGISIASKNFVTIDGINIVRRSNGINISGTSSFNTISNLSCNNNQGAGITTTASTCIINSFSGIDCWCNGSNGITLSSPSSNGQTLVLNSNGTSGLHCGQFGENTIVNGVIAKNNSGVGINIINCSYLTLIDATSENNGTYGISIFQLSMETKVFNGTISSNRTAGINQDTGKSFLRNISFTETTDVTGFTVGIDGRVYSEKHDGIADNHQIFTDGGLIRSETTVRHTASGISWAFLPTSTNRSATYPLDLSIAKIACAANALVTVKAWMRRTNTALTMRLVCKGGQLSGIPNDVVASMSAAADTWEQVEISFLPTESGVVEIIAEAYGGTTHTGYVDDLTITQA